MNLYCLVEGKTEKKVFPQWFSYLLPSLKLVESAQDAENNNYYLISGKGFPSILDNHLRASINEINEYGNYDVFMLCLDSDGLPFQEKISQVDTFMTENAVHPKCEMKIIIPNKCVETWFMGNRKIFTRTPSPNFIEFAKFYNVHDQNPEEMEKPDSFEESCSLYHYEYLKHMLLEKNIRYTKTHPNEVTKPHYIDQLKERLKKTPMHLQTLSMFFDFCQYLSDKTEQ